MLAARSPITVSIGKMIVVVKQRIRYVPNYHTSENLY